MPSSSKEITMSDTIDAAAAAAPQITLSAADYDRLSKLARVAMNSMPERAEDLLTEIERAHVVDGGRHPLQVVCMGSRVLFCDETTGRIQDVTLVYPPEANIAQGKISVLTPIGIALIGLHVGSSIDWQTRSGQTRRLTVIEVHDADGNRSWSSAGD
jgi:regulator of nucleoside diphosphate kinase